VVSQSSSTTSVASLTRQLAAHIGAPVSLVEPFIVEDRVPQTRSRHVTVIWNAWKNLPRDVRSRIILDAYQSSNRLHGDTVRVALGLTQQEAFDRGYLPFQIVPMIRKSDPVSPGEIRKALASIGGIHVKVDSARQVRFPSQSHAEEAYRRLAEKIHGPYWAITQEIAPIGRV
jgi:hypothetical protein